MNHLIVWNFPHNFFHTFFLNSFLLYNEQVEVRVKPEESLGLVIRGGAEHGVGIFVLHVDAGSLACRMGLKVSNILKFLILHIEQVPRLVILVLCKP